LIPVDGRGMSIQNTYHGRCSIVIGKNGALCISAGGGIVFVPPHPGLLISP
jgi:hypothetical protein